MALTGQAKTDYQREYMRKRRSNTKLNQSVRPIVRPKQQGHSPMMVGYVPRARGGLKKGETPQRGG